MFTIFSPKRNGIILSEYSLALKSNIEVKTITIAGWLSDVNGITIVITETSQCLMWGGGGGVKTSEKRSNFKISLWVLPVFSLMLLLFVSLVVILSPLLEVGFHNITKYFHVKKLESNSYILFF